MRKVRNSPDGVTGAQADLVTPTRGRLSTREELAATALVTHHG